MLTMMLNMSPGSSQLQMMCSKTASPAWSQNSEKVVMLIRRDLALLRNCCSALFEGTDDSIFTPAAARHHPLDASMGNWCKFCK